MVDLQRAKLINMQSHGENYFPRNRKAVLPHRCQESIWPFRPKKLLNPFFFSKICKPLDLSPPDIAKLVQGESIAKLWPFSFLIPLSE